MLPLPLRPPQACLYALLAYNTCLGQAITAAEDAAEDRAAEAAQHAQEFAQLYSEKATYMRRTAAAEARARGCWQGQGAGAGAGGAAWRCRLHAGGRAWQGLLAPMVRCGGACSPFRHSAWCPACLCRAAWRSMRARSSACRRSWRRRRRWAWPAQPLWLRFACLALTHHCAAAWLPAASPAILISALLPRRRWSRRSRRNSRARPAAGAPSGG